VSIPLNYNRKHVDERQVVLLSATWLLALAVASPVIFGINDVPDRDPGECKLEDNNYVVYSSVCSFFIPCPIMVLLYFGVFRGLRSWEESRKLKLRSSIDACRKLQHAAVAAAFPPLAGTIPGPLPMPLPRIIERDLAQCRLDDTGDNMQRQIPYPRQYRENSVPTVTFSQQLHRKKRAKINSRERKAMQVLPVVVGEPPGFLQSEEILFPPIRGDPVSSNQRRSCFLQSEAILFPPIRGNPVSSNQRRSCFLQSEAILFPPIRGSLPLWVKHQVFINGEGNPVEAAFSLLTTRGRLLWLYRSLCFMC